MGLDLGCEAGDQRFAGLPRPAQRQVAEHRGPNVFWVAGCQILGQHAPVVGRYQLRLAVTFSIDPGSNLSNQRASSLVQYGIDVIAPFR